jgi:Tfp pilus assembly protein PilF
MSRVQKQMEAGHVGRRDAEPRGDAADGQVDADAARPAARTDGHARLARQQEGQGAHLLEGASARAADARLLLACILYKNGGDQKRALQMLQLAAAVNKKHALLHNTWAWMLHKAERADEAQARARQLPEEGRQQRSRPRTTCCACRTARA